MMRSIGGIADGAPRSSAGVSAGWAVPRPASSVVVLALRMASERPVSCHTPTATSPSSATAAIPLRAKKITDRPTEVGPRVELVPPRFTHRPTAIGPLSWEGAAPGGSGGGAFHLRHRHCHENHARPYCSRPDGPPSADEAAC